MAGDVDDDSNSKAIEKKKLNSSSNSVFFFLLIGTSQDIYTLFFFCNHENRIKHFLQTMVLQFCS